MVADGFSRLGYMERQGSGLEKIIEWYRSCSNYTDEKKPVFISSSSDFIVTLPNLNYEGKTGLLAEKQDFNEEKTGLLAEKQDFKTRLESFNLSTPTRDNIMALYMRFGLSEPFTRSDIAETCGISKSPASALVKKMKELGLIKEADTGEYGHYCLSIDK